MKNKYYTRMEGSVSEEEADRYFSLMRAERRDIKAHRQASAKQWEREQRLRRDAAVQRANQRDKAEMGWT